VASEPDARTLSLSLLKRPMALLLIVVMAVGSVFLWIGIPGLWIYGVSQMVETTQPQLGPYLAIIIGVPVTMWIFGRFLYRMNTAYERVTGQTSEVRVQMPWHRSMRGERDTGRRTNVLEFVMICSVALCLLLFGIWFLFFAGSSLPTG
jgi:hypothetical protein